MIRRHVFDKKSPKIASSRKATGVDYAIWVQNCELADDELAGLFEIEERYIKRMRKLDWIPEKAVRDRIDNLILTRRI
ncbi:TPA: hypothetical protein U1D11_000671 [Streptococcus suis]|nr:hypothetical protein [Streptococcus suis]